MSYKRVVTKKGKTYGPYKYESYRDENGVVKKRYLGKAEEKKNVFHSVFARKSAPSKKGTKVSSSSAKVFSKIKDFKLPVTPKYVWFVLIALFLLLGFGFTLRLTGNVVSGDGDVSKEVIDVNVLEFSDNVFMEDGVVSTLQYRAVINRPVKWLKKVNVSESNVSVELPKGSSNISILTDEEVDEAIEEVDSYEAIVRTVDREDIVEGVILTGHVARDVKREEGILTRFWNWLTSFTILGNVILESEITEEIIETEDSVIVEVGDIIDNETEVAVEYYTQSPVANETGLANGKRIIISAPSELNYTDILAYTVVEGQGIRMDDLRLKLYWYADTSGDGDVGQQIEEELEEENVTEEIVEIPVEENVTEVVENISDENVTESLIVENITEIPEVEENITVEENVTIEPEVLEENETEIIIEETIEENVTEVVEEPAEDIVEESVEEVIAEELVEEVVEEPVEEVEEMVSLITGEVILFEDEDEMEREVEMYMDSSVEMDRSRVEVEFVPYDFDSDGYVDYIEWVVPHLSVQVYEIIYITQAEHLDANRELIMDVYNKVKAQDGVYTEPIMSGEYVRVWFEKELDSSKDITIYAKSNGSSSVEVYVKDGTELIAEFSPRDDPAGLDEVSDEGWYKIYLTELVGLEDSFDLRVVGDAVQFDYIVDPSPITLAVPQTFNIHGRLSNSTGAINGTFEFNFSIYDVYTGGSYIWNSVRNVTTDDEGVYDVILNVTGLNFTQQYYLGIAVEEDGEMTPRINLTSAPYAFMAQHVYVGGIIFDENMDASGYNITADYFIGDGSGLTNINGSGIWDNVSGVATYDGDVNITGNFTLGSTEINIDANGDVHVW
ncbi:hypothetical protein KAS08_05565 [Candidatus Pacearchaeota archaeon]|nr:hypothetical protein [Candidatus Pacearchaeota archaeon]